MSRVIWTISQLMNRYWCIILYKWCLVVTYHDGLCGYYDGLRGYYDGLHDGLCGYLLTMMVSVVTTMTVVTMMVSVVTWWSPWLLTMMVSVVTMMVSVVTHHDGLRDGLRGYYHDHDGLRGYLPWWSLWLLWWSPWLLTMMVSRTWVVRGDDFDTAVWRIVSSFSLLSIVMPNIVRICLVKLKQNKQI